MKTPNHLSFRLIDRSFSDHLTLYLLFPSIKIAEGFDYDTVDRGVTKFELALPTYLRWKGDNDHWSVSVRMLGLGVTLSRQTGY